MSIKNIISIFIGNILIAIAVAFFIVPSGMISGGVTGICLLLHTFLGFPMAGCIGIFNICLLSLGFFVMGRIFIMNTLISSIFYPFLYGCAEAVQGRVGIMTEDPFLNMVFAGVFFGTGVGLVLRQNASTGGVDIIAKILHRKFGFPISICLNIMDVIILLPQMYLATREQVLYGLLYVFLFAAVINRVLHYGAEEKIMGESA